VQILSRGFDRNVHLDLFEQTWQAMARPHYPFTATLYFDSEVARWILEDPFFYIVERLTDTHGVRVILSAPDAQAVLQWILGWGRHIISIEPEALRRQVSDELRTALSQLTKG